MRPVLVHEQVAADEPGREHPLRFAGLQVDDVTGLSAAVRKPSIVPPASENWLAAQLSGEQAAARAALGSSDGSGGEDERETLHAPPTDAGPAEVPDAYGPCEPLPS